MTFRRRQLFVLLLAVGTQAAPCLGEDAQSPQELRVAGVVLKWVRGDRDANLARLTPLVRTAAKNGAHVVCTTECFLDGYSIDDKSIPLEQFRSLGEPIPGGPYFTKLEMLADELDIYLIAGILERQGQQLYNTAVILGPDGGLLGKHRKQKLEHEAVRITPGADASPLATPIGSLGLMICADRRKPELVAELCAEGADVLFCPSGGMFGPRQNDWILQDRSRENEKFIVFTHPTEFLVTDPGGRIVQRVLLGDDLEMDADEIGTSQDSRGVFYFDFERNEAGQWQAAPMSRALSRQSVPTQAAKEEVRAYATRRVPDVHLGDSRSAWLEQAEKLRKRMLREVVFRGTAEAWRDAPSQVHWHDEVVTGRGYRIRKFRYEALPGFWIPALLYEPAELRDKMPVVINPNGHHRGGKAMPYKQRRCINLARRGMLAYSLEFIDMGQLSDRDNRHNRLVQLDLCGAAGLAPFYLALTRAVDVALDHPNVDPDRVAVAGLSGGGWQSILLSALDTRITLANPVAGYCSLHERIQGDNNIGDAEQIPSDMCAVADYTHLTAMVAPRPLLLTYNAQDECCFVPDQILPRLERIGRAAYQLCEVPEHFAIHINHDPGTHNFDQDNREAFYRQIHEHLIPEASLEPVEMPVDDSEILSEDALAVPMPEKNLTLHQLALKLSESLPDAGEQSPQNRRDRLAEVVRHQSYDIQDELIEESQTDDAVIRRVLLRLGTDWTLPAVEFRPGDFKGTTVLISDWGKQSLTAEIDALLAAKQRVVAVDLLGFGEADAGPDPGGNDDVMLVLLATVGERPLGIQSGQLAAVFDWANASAQKRPADVVAVGPRCSTIALVAAAIHPEAIGTLTTHRARASLRELIEENLAVDDAPEQFCFGLLKEFDIPQLHDLIGADRVVVGSQTQSTKF